MKIIINALQFKQNNSGIGVMIRELFAALTQKTQWQCMAVLSQDSPTLPSMHAACVRSPWPHEKNLKRMLFQTFQMGRQYCKDAVLLTTDSKIPFFLPHSCIVIPVITDMAVYRMGEVYRKSRTLWWKFQYQYVKHRADHYAAISEFTKREMTDILGISPEKIDVVPCAASPCIQRVDDEAQIAAFRWRYNLPKRFLLFTGNNNPRKNIRRILESFDLAQGQLKESVGLVIAGEQGWKFNREETLRGIQHQKDVLFTGFVSDKDLPLLYSAAEGFLFPTLYEGFGIPVLEAQQCGTPVIASNCSALPETGGDAALYVDPKNPSSIAEAMVQLLTDEDLRQKLVQKGYENAKRFSWDESAEKLNEIIEKVVAQCQK